MIRWAAIGLVALVGAGVSATSPAAAQPRPPSPDAGNDNAQERNNNLLWSNCSSVIQRLPNK
jgi:hypothetical protein